MKQMKIADHKTIFVFACLTLSLLITTPSHAEPVPLGRLGCDAPKLEGLEWVKGDPVEMKNGSIYVVEFWATWCGPCIKGIPHLTELQETYRDKNVTVIGVSNETNGKVRPFVKKQGDNMAYTVAIDAGGKMSEGYMKAFKQNGIPHAFIVDQTGKIAWHGHPMAMDESLEKIVSGTYDLEATTKKMAEAEQEKERMRATFQAQREAQEKQLAEVSARVEKDPENLALLIERAEAYLGVSFTTDLSYRPADLLKSIQDYKTAMELDPADPHHIAEHLAFFEAWQDQTDKRIEKLKVFTEAYPDSIRVPFAAYALYYDAQEKGNADQAFSYLTRAAETAPEGRFGTAMRDMQAQAEKQR